MDYVSTNRKIETIPIDEIKLNIVKTTFEAQHFLSFHPELSLSHRLEFIW